MSRATIQQRLHWLRDAINHLRERHNPADEKEDSIKRFIVHLRAVERDMIRLQQDVATDGHDDRLSELWFQYLSLSLDFRELTREHWDYYFGQEVRGSNKNGTEGRYSEAVDKLIDSINMPKVGRNVPSASCGVAFLHRLAVRIPYCDLSIWGLPYVFHDYAHCVFQYVRSLYGYSEVFDTDTFNSILADPDYTQRLETMIHRDELARLVAELRRNRDRRFGIASNEAHLTIAHHMAEVLFEELWADVYATYIGGIAYAASSIVKYLMPLRIAVSEDRIGAPGVQAFCDDIRRGHVILATLDTLGSPHGHAECTKALATLRKLWEEILKSSGQPEMPQIRDWAARFATAVLARLDVPCGEPYKFDDQRGGNSMSQAVEVKRVFKEALVKVSFESEQFTKSFASFARTGNATSRRDVLTALWLIRLQADDNNLPGRLDEVGWLALKCLPDPPAAAGSSVRDGSLQPGAIA